MQIWIACKSLFQDLHNKTILFKIGNYIFVTYGLFLGLGFLAALMMSLYYNFVTGFNLDELLTFYLIILLPSIFIGVRLLSIIENILDGKVTRFTKKNIITLIFSPGFNIQGGIVIGIVTIVIYCYLRKLPTLVIFDACALGVALGESIGRVGCHTYGCCWGKTTTSSFSIAYENAAAKVLRIKPYLFSVRLHPAQIYSAMISFLLFLFLFWLIPYVKYDGMITATFLVLHGTCRLIIDKVRDDPRGVIFKNFLLSTFSALLEITIGIIFLLASFEVSQHHIVQSNKEWMFIYLQPPILLKIILFTVIAAIYFGSHFKQVGSWVPSNEN